jgi:hypothetical protein
VGCPFEQPGVNVEDVAGKGFPPGRSAEQKGEFAIGAGMLREVVVDDEHVAPGLHEVLRDAGCGVGGGVGETGRVVALGHDHDGVFHRALLLKDGHSLGHCRGTLPDGAVDTDDIFALLVEDRVDRDGGLARLPVAEDQFALAAPDGNERVDDLQPSLQWHGDRGAVHDGRGGSLDGQAPGDDHGARFVQRSAKRVDDAAQQAVAHAHVHNPAGALDFVSSPHVRVVAKKHHPDLVRVHVEGDAEHVAGKLDQFVGADAGQAGDSGDAGGNASDGSHLARRQLRREGIAPLAEARERAVEDILQ